MPLDIDGYVEVTTFSADQQEEYSWPCPRIRRPEYSPKCERIADFDDGHGRGEFGGYTHADWREIKGAIAMVDVRDSDWALVFDLVRRIEQDHRFSDDRTRFVVWYCW